MTNPEHGSGPDPSGWQPGQQPPQTPPPGYVPPPGGQYPPGGFPPGGPPPPGYGGPGSPYGYDPNIDPMTGQPLSDKTKLVAGLLQILIGGVGAGRWYTGHTGMALAQLFTCGGCGIWALIDGILLLTQGGTDAQGRKLRES